MFEFLVESVEGGTAKNGSQYLKCIVNDSEKRQTLFIWGYHSVPRMEEYPCYLKVDTLQEKTDCLSAQARDCVFFEYELIPQDSVLRAIKVKGDWTSADLIMLADKLLDKFKFSERMRMFVKTKVYPYLKTYENYPAGAKVHHPWINGLSSHTYEILRFVEEISNVGCADCDWEVVVVAALLHDYGKTLEYGEAYSYKKEMFLYGHSFLGANLLQVLLRDFMIETEYDSTFEEKICNATHCILSHHQQKEYGATVVPATKEAMIVSYCDLLSARCDMFDRTSDGELNKYLGTSVIKQITPISGI